MAPKVVFLVEAEHAQAIQAFLDVSNAIRQTGSAAQQAGQQGAQGAQATGNAWQNALSALNPFTMSLRGMLSTTYLITKSVEAIQAQFERMKDIKISAFEGAKEWMPSFYRAQVNAGDFGKSPEFLRLMQKGATNLGDSSGSPKAALDLAADIFGGGSASFTDKEIAKSYEMTSKFAGRLRMPGEEAAEFGGALQDLARGEHLKGHTWDLEELGGMFTSNLRQSRATNINQEARFGMRSVESLANFQNMTLPWAFAQESAFSQLLPDKFMRQSGSGLKRTWEEINKAYGDVLEATEEGFPGAPDVPSFIKLSPEKKFEYIQGKSETAQMLRARLFGNQSGDAEERELATAYSWGGGSLSGEAGIPEIARGLFEKTSPVFKLIETIRDQIPSGEAAVKEWRDFVEGPLRTEIDRASEMMRATAGQKAAVELNRLQEAQQGAVMTDVSDSGKQAGINFMSQALRDYGANISTEGKNETQLRQLLGDYTERSINDIRGNDISRRGPAMFRGPQGAQASAEYYKWLKKRGLTVGQSTPSLEQEFTDERLSAADKNKIEAMREKLRIIDDIEKRSAPEFSPISEPSGVAEPVGPPVEQHSMPGNRDQSLNQINERLNRLADTIQQLAEADSSRRLDVFVEDKSGRPLSRSTSRPRAIEQFYDGAA